MKNENMYYSNRQVKTGEDVFAPNDPLAFLVDGRNQSLGEIVVTTVSPELEYVPERPLDEDSVAEDDFENFEEEGTIGVVTNVTFEQVGRFTGNGTFIADVTAIIEDVEGAVDYAIEYVKVS